MKLHMKYALLQQTQWHEVDKTDGFTKRTCEKNVSSAKTCRTLRPSSIVEKVKEKEKEFVSHNTRFFINKSDAPNEKMFSIIIEFVSVTM